MLRRSKDQLDALAAATKPTGTKNSVTSDDGDEESDPGQDS
jgi:hypothetical protein